MSLADLKAELLRTEYPTLRPDHDPDIERYFLIRAKNGSSAALSFYETRLKPRYPDEADRTAALRAFRLRDPAYRNYIAKAYDSLGDRLLERTKRLIKYVAMHASSYDRTDAYQTIRAAESMLRMLPRDKFEAVAAVERLRRHAELIGYLAPSMEAAEDLVRAYLNERLDIVETERARRREERERSFSESRSLLVQKDLEDARKALDREKKREDERRQSPVRRRVSAEPAAAFDLSAIRFSQADLSRIQIPPSLTKVEDKTLAYCFKYWNLVEDRTFERTIFLYSRKHGTRNYDAFVAIRDGRRRDRRDEEILSTVLGLLTSGYYYSISGDVYLQRNWARLKALIEAPKQTERKRKPRREQTAAKPREKVATTKAAVTPAPATIRPSKTKPVKTSNHTVGFRAKPAAPKMTPRNATPRPLARKTRKKKTRDAQLPKPIAATPEKPKVARGSVSDRLRKLSGRSYDVFRDRFFLKVGASIRSVLASTREGRKALFPSVPQEAEKLVFGFLRDNYTDPYMDWEGSEEKKTLSAMGYELSSVDPVIEDCYRRL